MASWSPLAQSAYASVWFKVNLFPLVHKVFAVCHKSAAKAECCRPLMWFCQKEPGILQHNRSLCVVDRRHCKVAPASQALPSNIVSIVWFRFWAVSRVNATSTNVPLFWTTNSTTWYWVEWMTNRPFWKRGGNRRNSGSSPRRRSVAGLWHFRKGSDFLIADNLAVAILHHKGQSRPPLWLTASVIGTAPSDMGLQ